MSETRSEPCPFCHSTGRMWSANPRSSAKVKCRNCDGHGYVTPERLRWLLKKYRPEALVVTTPQED